MVLCQHCGTANRVGQVRCVKCDRNLVSESMRGKIPCANHSNREATTSCNTCGTRLCDACAYEMGGIDFCENCAPEGAIEREHDSDYEAIPVVDGGSTEHAGVAWRLAAFLIDLLLWVVFGIIFAVVLAMFNGGWAYKKGYLYLATLSKPSFWVYWCLMVGVTLIYNTLLIGMDGRTLGKRVMGIIILQEDGRIADSKEALVRAFGQWLSLLPLGLGYLWALWDPNHETWHDKLSKTVAFRYQDLT